jgi:hypothetical protein
MIGVVFDPLSTSSAINILNGIWWCEGELVEGAFGLDTGIREEAEISLHTGRLDESSIPPPYLTAIAADQQGAIRKIWIRGAWTNGREILLVESELEREFVTRTRAKGEFVYKIHLKRELDQLASALPVTGRLGGWGCRPDFLVSKLDSPKLFVVEVVGYPKTEKNREYYERLEAKRLIYESLLPPWDYLEEKAYEYKKMRGPRFLIIRGSTRRFPRGSSRTWCGKISKYGGLAMNFTKRNTPLRLPPYLLLKRKSKKFL